MRTRLSFALGALLLVTSAASLLHADHAPFLGRWNLTGTGADSTAIFWLELTEENGQLSGRFLNRGGSPVKLAKVEVRGDELVFQVAGNNNTPGPVHTAKLVNGTLTGSTTIRDRELAWVGARPPVWKPANANGAHTFGKPVDLTSLEPWGLQRADRPSGWTMAEGAMTNEKGANNLVSKETFRDFRIQAEYKIDPGSNSGIYLRGRYELQVLDDFGKPPEEHGHMAIYAWVRPLVNASRPGGEWQSMDATIVGNRVTVLLNGRKVHDNAQIQAITGGALDANEDAPGPIMLQGDHGKVWYRKVVVTPIVKATS